jgi:hypothetical protein
MFLFLSEKQIKGFLMATYVAIASLTCFGAWGIWAFWAVLAKS